MQGFGKILAIIRQEQEEAKQRKSTKRMRRQKEVEISWRIGQLKSAMEAEEHLSMKEKLQNNIAKELDRARLKRSNTQQSGLLPRAERS